MSRLLLDQNIDRRVGPGLVARGHEAVHLSEFGMERSTDREVMARAVAEDRVVVTHDSDFAQLLARPGAGAPSVIRLRVPLAGYAELIALLDEALAVAEADLAAGAVVSISPRGARIRRLPIGSASQ